MMLRTMMPRTRLEWVKKLAGAGMWIAIGASSYVASTRPEWKWAAAGCIMALAVVSAVAGIPAGWPAGGWCFGRAAASAGAAGMMTAGLPTRQ
jgi:hypothetical protein